MSASAAVTATARAPRMPTALTLKGQGHSDHVLSRLRSFAGKVGGGTIVPNVVNAAGESLLGAQKAGHPMGNAHTAIARVTDLLTDWRKLYLEIHRSPLRKPSLPAVDWQALGDTFKALRQMVYEWSIPDNADSALTASEGRRQSVSAFVSCLQRCLIPATISDFAPSVTAGPDDFVNPKAIFEKDERDLGTVPPLFQGTAVETWHHPIDLPAKGRLLTLSKGGEPLGAVSFRSLESPIAGTCILVDNTWLNPKIPDGATLGLTELLGVARRDPDLIALLFPISESRDLGEPGWQNALQQMGAVKLNIPYENKGSGSDAALAIIPMMPFEDEQLSRLQYLEWMSQAIKGEGHDSGIDMEIGKRLNDLAAGVPEQISFIPLDQSRTEIETSPSFFTFAPPSTLKVGHTIDDPEKVGVFPVINRKLLISGLFGRMGSLLSFFSVH